MRCPFSIGGLDVRFFVALFSIIVYKGYGKDEQHRKTYVVRYKNGDSTIPVTVVLDYKKQAEYVINMNPRSPTKSITFYDFKQKSIAYKDMTNRECFVSQLSHETLQEENEILKTLQNPVEATPLILTLDPTRRSLTPTQIRNMAGQKIAMFCRKMATWRLQDNSIQKRSRRQVAESSVDRRYEGNNNENEDYSSYDQGADQPAHNSPSANINRKRKSKQMRRKNRTNLPPKATDSQLNVYHRQAFNQNSRSDNLYRGSENNHRKNTFTRIQPNPQKNHTSVNRIGTHRLPRFHNNLYPRAGAYYNNLGLETKANDESRPLGSAFPPRQPPLYHPSEFNAYRPAILETRRNFHSPVFNESSDEIFEQWSHPLRIPSRRTHNIAYDSHYDTNINSLPYGHFPGYVQPLRRSKAESNNFENQWSLPLRYNSSTNEDLFPSERTSPTNEAIELSSRTEYANKNNSLNEFAYDTLEDSVIGENKPSYQSLFYSTRPNEETTQTSAIPLSLRESDTGSNGGRRDFDVYTNSSTLEDLKILIDPKVAHEKQQERSDLPSDEDFVLIKYSDSQNESTSNRNAFRHNTQLHQQNSTSNGYPKRQERLQNALKLFTPDEIIIDIGQYPTEDQSTHTPIFNDHQSPTNIPTVLEPPIRTLQQRPKQITRPPLRNSYPNSGKNAFLNQVPDRNIYTANHNIFPSSPNQQPQLMPAVLPPGFAVYPRHPKAPYANLASLDTQRTIVSPKFPNNRHSIHRQHHQRHQHKKQNGLCCSRQQNQLSRPGSCCASRGACCTTHHRGQYLTTCCPRLNDSRQRSRPTVSITTEERAAADQQYNSASTVDSQELCEKKKMCRTLYQSTQAVMLCRNGEVPGC